ncbi:hypothetical protein TNCV_1560841 [Trichonephila clavipes]|nr:hypothetical protein TNCV_1560841 [Trichonephila clavipes]
MMCVDDDVCSDDGRKMDIGPLPQVIILPMLEESPSAIHHATLQDLAKLNPYSCAEEHSQTFQMSPSGHYSHLVGFLLTTALHGLMWAIISDDEFSRPCILCLRLDTHNYLVLDGVAPDYYRYSTSLSAFFASLG